MIDLKNKLLLILLEKSGGSSIGYAFTGKDWWGVFNNFLKDKNYFKHIRFYS